MTGGLKRRPFLIPAPKQCQESQREATIEYQESSLCGRGAFHHNGSAYSSIIKKRLFERCRKDGFKIDTVAQKSEASLADVTPEDLLSMV